MTTSTPTFADVNPTTLDPTVRQRLRIATESSVRTMEPVWMESIHIPAAVHVDSAEGIVRQDSTMVIVTFYNNDIKQTCQV